MMYTITKTVRALGINATYLGYRYLIEGVRLAMEQEDVLLSVCTRLYPAIAAKYHSTPDNVERNLRTVISVCWERGNRTFLESVFSYPLTAKPSVSEMIDALADYCRSVDNPQ